MRLYLTFSWVCKVISLNARVEILYLPIYTQVVHMYVRMYMSIDWSVTYNISYQFVFFFFLSGKREYVYSSKTA